ncbi:beta strand repeat-containing protein [Ralstonia sp. 25C]|uniref:beta strand repeat-containing protein n=1 Tax=Ralstonia sp. 25C TaxID=3447363 RepID=UPI003F750AF7
MNAKCYRTVFNAVRGILPGGSSQPVRQAAGEPIQHLVIGLRARDAHAKQATAGWILLRYSLSDCLSLMAALDQAPSAIRLRPYRLNAPAADAPVRWLLRRAGRGLLNVVGVTKQGREIYASLPMPADRFRLMVRPGCAPTGPYEQRHGQMMFFDRNPEKLRTHFGGQLLQYRPVSTQQRNRPLVMRPADVRRLSAKRQGLRRSAISMSVCAAIATAAPARFALATDYTTPITGSSTADTAYSTSTNAAGSLVYGLQSGDTISASTNQLANLQAVNLVGVTTPVVLQVGSNGTGTLGVSATRTGVTDFGIVHGIDVENGSHLTINGNTNVNARTDNANSEIEGVYITNSTATFNGNTTISTSTPGYSRGLWINRGNVTFNGDTTITVRGHGTDNDGIYNSGGGAGNVTFNGNVKIDSLGEHPSDNVHGIYNDNINTRLTINGNLDLSATSNGLTVFGIRNQGVLNVSGDMSVTATGPRSAMGVANTHRTARFTVGGNLDIHVVNTGGYTPFGLPTAIQAHYGTGSSMTFRKGVNATVNAATTAFGIDNTGVMNFSSASDTVALNVASTCTTCNVFGINQNGGSITMAGGAQVKASATGTGAAFAIANAAANGVNATLDINAAGAGKVTLDGDITTANYVASSNTGSTNVVLNTADSYFKGNIVPYSNTGLTTDTTNYVAGATTLNFSNGATWVPTGTGTGNTSNDFGAGGLTLASGGGIDLSRSWGTFAPGSIPAYNLRTVTIDSSAAGGASVNLKDGATFTLLSDVRNGAADKVVFGSGISNFSAAGTQNIKIAYDPVLQDTSWVNANTVKTGKTFNAAAPITLVDASAAAGGAAKLAAVSGTPGAWTSTYENALVSFTYTPQVAVSSDGNKVLLTGIQIAGSDGSSTGTGGSPGATSPTNPNNQTSPGTPTVPTLSTGLATSSGIRPAEAVLTASESVVAMRNLLLRTSALAGTTGTGGTSGTTGINTPQQAGNGEGSVWLTPMASRDTADVSYGRQTSESVTSLSLGADRRVYQDDRSTVRVGASITQANANVGYTRGSGTINMTSVGVNATLQANSGPYVTGGISGATLRNTYNATDLEGTNTSGKFNVKTLGSTLAAGWPFDLGHGVSLEPSTAAVAGVMFGDQRVTSASVTTDLNRKTFGIVNAGVTLKHTGTNSLGSHEIYGRVARLETFGSDLSITASKDGGSITADAAPARRSGYQVVLGGSVGFGNVTGLALTMEAGRQHLSGSSSGWSGLASVRYRW